MQKGEIERMAIIETKLDNVIDALKDNKEEHKDIMDEIQCLGSQKADKSEVKKLKDFLTTTLISLLGILLSIVGYFIVKFIIK